MRKRSGGTPRVHAGAAAGAGIETGRIIVGATAGKVKDALAPKDDGPKVELPPGVDGE
jgi:hypothetical protein